jgi:DNA-binding XRE family transcriptional regulator/ubiquitin
MAAQKKVGDLIKEARTKAGLSQEKLAGMIEGLSASELSKAERNEKDLTQAELKAIAKICGVTQKSLLEAPSGVKKTTAAKTSTAAKTTAAKTTAAKTSTAKTTTSSSTSTVKLTAAEKRVLELYRAADAATKKNAEAVLKGTKKVQEDSSDLVGTLLGGALEAITGLGKK